METQDRTDNLGKYLGQMVAIKQRVKAIRDVLEAKTGTSYTATDEEFIFLQFRKILELIAFSTLICNRDIYSEMHSNFANQWRAKDILNKIEKLNPNFYPQPIIISPSSKSPNIDEFVRRHDGFLTRSEFVDLYQEASNYMHSSNPFGPNQDNKEDLNSYFHIWLNKIITLLNPHTIQLIDESIFYYISMGNEDPETVSGNVFSRT